jgi:predicted Zn-dependent protease
MARLPAEFLDGWSLAEKRVSVELEPEQLRIFDAHDRELGVWTVDGLRCDAMQEGVLHVSHAAVPHESLVVNDAELARQLLSVASTVKALPGGTRTTRFVLACSVAMALLVTLIYVFTPAISRFAARQVPLERERMLGMQLEAMLSYSKCADPETERALGALKQSVLGSHASDFEVRMVNVPQPNAFALPGGLIVLTEGLAREAESGDELAGVLAHEIEHVTERHVLAGLLRDTALTFLWSITVGDYAGLLVVDPSTAYHVANLEFSRDDEDAADRGAVARLHRAGLSHQGLSTFFQRLHAAEKGDGPEWLSTHPSTGQRIERLARVPDLGSPRPALEQANFAVLQRGCK